MFLVSSGGICIAQSLKIPHDHKPSDFDKIIRLLLDTHYARAVILFASDEDIRQVITLDFNTVRTGWHSGSGIIKDCDTRG